MSNKVSGAIILFDGECQFCDASVNWIIAHDHAKKFHFAARQSNTGNELLGKFGAPDLDSLILAQDGKIFTRSSAVLRIARTLPFPWFLFYVFHFIPTVLRDALYDFFAAHRYRWFGKTPTCRLPTREMQERFLN